MAGAPELTGACKAGSTHSRFFAAQIKVENRTADNLGRRIG
jgi:hypothetical protein